MDSAQPSTKEEKCDEKITDCDSLPDIACRVRVEFDVDIATDRTIR